MLIRYSCTKPYAFKQHVIVESRILNAIARGMKRLFELSTPPPPPPLPSPNTLPSHRFIPLSFIFSFLYFASLIFIPVELGTADDYLLGSFSVSLKPVYFNSACIAFHCLSSLFFFCIFVVLRWTHLLYICVRCTDNWSSFVMPIFNDCTHSLKKGRNLILWHKNCTFCDLM